MEIHDHQRNDDHHTSNNISLSKEEICDLSDIIFSSKLTIPNGKYLSLIEQNERTK